MNQETVAERIRREPLLYKHPCAKCIHLRRVDHEGFPHGKCMVKIVLPIVCAFEPGRSWLSEKCLDGPHADDARELKCALFIAKQP